MGRDDCRDRIGGDGATFYHICLSQGKENVKRRQGSQSILIKHIQTNGRGRVRREVKGLKNVAKGNKLAVLSRFAEDTNPPCNNEH